MNYTLYLRTETGDYFLQKAFTEDDLKKSHATVQRWIAQMDLKVTNPNTALLVIAKGKYGTHVSRYIAGGRRTWRELTDLKDQIIRDPETAQTASTKLEGWQAAIRSGAIG